MRLSGQHYVEQAVVWPETQATELQQLDARDTQRPSTADAIIMVWIRCRLLVVACHAQRSEAVAGGGGMAQPQPQSQSHSQPLVASWKSSDCQLETRYAL